MTATEKAKVRKLMSSRRGLIQEACAAAGYSRVLYYSIMNDKSNNILALNRIIACAKELKGSKVTVEI